MTLPIPVVGQIIDSVGNVVSSGFGLLGDLIRGHMARQERKLALEELQIKAEEARKTLELEVNLDIKTRETNLRILQGMMEIVQDVVRTDVELKSLAIRHSVEMKMLIGNWQLATQQSLFQETNKLLHDLGTHIKMIDSFNEIERERIKEIAYTRYEMCNSIALQDYESIRLEIMKTNQEVRTRAEKLASSFELHKILRLAGMDTLKLLNEYPEDSDR